ARVSSPSRKPSSRQPLPKFVDPDPNPDFYNRSNWTAIGHAARNRVWHLGSGAFVAWRSRLADRCLALFRRLNEYARGIRPDSATIWVDDGGSRGSRRDVTFWWERGLLFRGDADILLNAPPHAPPQELTLRRQTRSRAPWRVH